MTDDAEQTFVHEQDNRKNSSQIQSCKRKDHILVKQLWHRLRDSRRAGIYIFLLLLLLLSPSTNWTRYTYLMEDNLLYIKSHINVNQP